MEATSFSTRHYAQESMFNDSAYAKLAMARFTLEVRVRVRVRERRNDCCCCCFFFFVFFTLFPPSKFKGRCDVMRFQYGCRLFVCVCVCVCPSHLFRAPVCTFWYNKWVHQPVGVGWSHRIKVAQEFCSPRTFLWPRTFCGAYLNFLSCVTRKCVPIRSSAVKIRVYKMFRRGLEY